MICHPWASMLAMDGKSSLATVNLPTKFDESISTHYEDMKGRTGVVWGS